MNKYIDKSALVAEIERLKTDALQKKSQCKRSGLERIVHQIGAYNKILYFLNTMEVKEVDLDWQDIYSILYIERIVMREFGDKEYSNEELCLEVLKRFKAQKGE